MEEKKDDADAAKDDDSIKIFFNPAHYTVMENVGQFSVTISREGDLNPTVCVDFKTEDGTANAGSDYESVEGTLIFRPGEAHKQVITSFLLVSPYKNKRLGKVQSASLLWSFYENRYSSL